MIKYDYQKFDLLFFYYYCRYSIAVKWLFRMLQMRPCGIDKIRSDRTSDQKPDVYRFETEEAMNLNAFIRGNKATQQQQPPPPAVIGMM
jgi:hypothetical protein